MATQIPTVKWETNKILYNNKDELKTRIMAEFTNLNKETKKKKKKKLSGGYGSSH